MGFRKLEYQDRVLTALDTYLCYLKEEKQKSGRISDVAAKNQDLDIPIPDFTVKAWEKLEAAGKLPVSRKEIPYSKRKDGCGRPVPNVVLKVPTGGGKTFLGVLGVSKIMGQYLSENTGFVLWIVPNEAIYRQTLKHFKDRQHPYRQTLDQISAGRVKIMEKATRLNKRDVDANLCIMLLMMQSANRKTREWLKIFRDRGDVHGFTPPEGEEQVHRKLKDDIQNLETYGGDIFMRVKDSLGNALRIIRPLVILDEGHKAISDLAFETIYGFNPSFVLELTATPKDVRSRGGRNPRHARYANLLVEVTGRDLDREDMIKMPLTLTPCQGTDWRATLQVALTKLSDLQIHAKQLQADKNQYIRPILLIQVERTGRDQVKTGYVHSDEVKKWLLSSGGFDESEIAIKTSEQNDLSRPKNQDLLSSSNRIRVIITKQALQEGWDCPFAYILCTLATSSNLNALTQLVGRILRQPNAMKTGNEALDECYVVTHHAETATVVGAIKNGLEKDGLGDLVLNIRQGDSGNSGNGIQRIHRRESLHSTEIYLPEVMMVDGVEVRELDYETDVLSRIDWQGYDPEHIVRLIPENFQPHEAQLQRITLTDGDELIRSEGIASSSEDSAFDPTYAVQQILDIVPNPFVGREIVGRLLDGLHNRGFSSKKLGRMSRFIVEKFYQKLSEERDSKAEILFRQLVDDGHIQFRLRLDGRNWRMPRYIDASFTAGNEQLTNEYGGPLERSLFIPQYQSEYNKDERKVAAYLDGNGALAWWHRNVARTQYGIQGWRKGKIYPDFIFAVQTGSRGQCITAIETKGDHLDNLDTDYKRKLLSFLSIRYPFRNSIPAGELELVSSSGQTMYCELILMSEWETRLQELIDNIAEQ